MPLHPEFRRLRQRRHLAPARWLVAFATVLTGVIAMWIVNPQPISTADGTGGTGGESQPSITVSFVNSTGDPIDSVVLSNDGDQADIYVAVEGMAVGEHDTVQLQLRHAESLVDIVFASCAGVFEGAFSPPDPVEISPGESAFECGLHGGVTAPDGIVASFTLQRLAAGDHILELITEGSFGVGLFSAGVRSPVLTGPTVAVLGPSAITPTTPVSSGGGGSGSFSNPQPSSGPTLFAPGLPRLLRVTAGDGSAVVSWQPPDSNSGSDITQYVVRSGDGGIRLIVSGASTSVIVTGLENGVEYRFRVQAINIAGIGPFTEPSVPVVPAGPPSTPQNVVAHVIDGTAEVLISWSAPEHTNGAEIESYLITEATGRTKSAILAASATSHLIELLETGDYLFTVVATNSAGPGHGASLAFTLPESPEGAPPETTDDPNPGQGAPTDINQPILIQPLSESEKTELAEQVGALVNRRLVVRDDPFTVTTSNGQLRVEIPIRLTGEQTESTEFNGFNIGGLSVESAGGSPAIGRVDLGNGLAISGNVTLGSDTDSVTVVLSDMELLFAVSLPPPLDREQQIAGPVAFATSISSISGMPEISALFLDSIGPPHLPYVAQIVSGLRDDGWPLFTDEPEVDFVFKIEHSDAGSLSIGDTTLSFLLTEPLEPGVSMIAVKQNDEGALFSRPVTCKSFPGELPSCLTIFDGSAGGFSTFAVLRASSAPEVEQGSDTGAIPPTLTPISEPTALPVLTEDRSSPPEDAQVERSQAELAPVPTADPKDTFTSTESAPQIEPDGLSSLIVIVVVGSVFGIAGLGGVGYFLNRRLNPSVPLLTFLLAGGAMLTLMASTPDSQIASASGLAADPVGGEGDIAQRSDLLRIAEGLDGTGVTIGIISDSYGCDQDALDADIAAGELPENVTILQDAPGIFCSITTDRGRAMAQIIHDVAPGARIVFQANVFGKTTMAKSIPLLVGAGADIIVDDASFDSELHFQDDVVAQAIDAAVAAGTLYFSSAGDDGISAYESAFVDGGSVAPTCSPSEPPICVVPGTLHDFDAGPGVDQFLEVSLPTGRTSVRLHWDQPGQSAGGAANSAVIDLFVYDSADVPIATAAFDNSASGDPFESLSVSGHSSIQVAVSHRSGPVPGRIRLVVTDGAIVTEHNTNSGTITGHSNAASAITVGSVHYSDTAAFGGTPVVESRSSRGGVEILFAQDGTRLNIPLLRQKPDIVAPSGATTTMGPLGGTASAAAHAAGAAALLLALDTGVDLQQEQLRWLLADTAVEVGADGPDFESGFGLIDIFEAAQTLMLEPPVAISDQYVVDMNSVLTVPAPGVMANDLDLNGHALEPVLLIEPENGELALSPDGSFTYISEVGFFGADSFTYEVTDGAFTSEQVLVNISVLGIESVSTSVVLQGAAPGANFGADRVMLMIDGDGVSDQTEFDPAGPGSVGFTGLGPGSYMVAANAPGYLEAVQTDVVLGAVVGTEIVLPTTKLLAGDATDDGMIDTADADVLTDAFGIQLEAGTRRDSDGNIADLTQWRRCR